ncbi:MAG: histidine kinase [Gammaproteobacteria bacterium HGW-Gammaproteobacteria-3]|nr:MAG: histidine kinase [Gammaproteobacteria bacterium HGW-Gammaproteobacteria-3]
MPGFIESLSFCIVIAQIQQTEPLILKIRELNANAAKLFGYPAQSLINQPLDSILAQGRPPDFWQTALEGLGLNTDKSLPAFSMQAELINASRHCFPALISLCRLTETSASPFPAIALFIQDISANKAQENNLFLMHMAVEQSASAVIITNPQGRIEYVNPKFCSMTGFSKEELLGYSPKILQSGDTSIEQYQFMWQNLLEQGEWRGEIKNQKKSGEDYWAFESISAIKNKQGKITHLLAVEEDITQRKQFESALKESEERFRQMAEMTGEWLWEQDPDGFYIYSSNAVKAIIGYDPKEVIGKHYTELLTPQDKVDVQTYANIQHGFYGLTNHYRHKDGHPVIAESTGLPITDSRGHLLKWRGVDRDITARKHYEDALIESEKRKRLIIETALNAIIIMDHYGIIIDWNSKAERMFGWSRDEAIGRNLAGLIIPERFRQAHNEGLQNFLHGGKNNIMNKLTEQIALKKDGTEFPVEFSVAPLKIGNAYEFSGFVHDISGRKAAEEQIRQAQVNLAIAENEMKIAQQIQASLFPAQAIVSAKFEVSGHCLPSTRVGGDYFDYFYRDPQHLDMVIADVSGHAVGPALLMVSARSAIRTQANQQGTPAQTLDVLNNFLYDDLNNANHFITLFYLQYDMARQTLSYANAGHPMPLLYSRADNKCRQLDADGLIIGIRKNIRFEEKNVELAPGDCLLMYTDGLTEAENPRGEFFGTERLINVFSQVAEQKPQVIIEEIIRHLKQFYQTESFNDDVTLMVFQQRPTNR